MGTGLNFISRFSPCNATQRSAVPRACLDQHLIAIRSPGIRGDHVRLGTSLIAIIYIAGPSHLLYKLRLITDRAFGNSD